MKTISQVLFLLLALGGFFADAADRPNIVLIFADDNSQ